MNRIARSYIQTHPTHKTIPPTFAPATCEHTDRPAWPPSETGDCHECHDLAFRRKAWAISAATFRAAEAAAGPGVQA